MITYTIPKDLQTFWFWRHCKHQTLVNLLANPKIPSYYGYIWRELERRRYIRLHRFMKYYYPRLPIQFDIEPILLGQILTDLNYQIHWLSQKINWELAKKQVSTTGRLIGLFNDFYFYPQAAKLNNWPYRLKFESHRQ